MSLAGSYQQMKVPEEDLDEFGDPIEKKQTLLQRYNMWFFDKFRYSWYYSKFKYPLNDFKRGIKNMIKWLPLVWKDRDYDDYYIMKVLSFKIKNTAAHIDKHEIICDESREEIRRYARIMVELIKRMHDEDYQMEYMDYHKSKYNWIDCDDEELNKTGHKQLDIVEEEEHYDDYFAKYPLAAKRARKFIAEKYKEPNRIDDKSYVAMTMAHMRQDKANKLIFKIMGEKIEKFWD